ncbi:MAG TPA: hypothetical protein VGB20_02240 [bacterium]
MTSRTGRCSPARPHRPARRGRAAGLTFIELLVAVVVLAAVGVSVMPALGAASRALSVADARTTAQLFAASKLADAELAAQQGREPDESSSGTFAEGGLRYRWAMQAGLHPAGPQLRQVRLSVTWPRGPHTDAYALATILRVTPPPAP